MRFFSFSLLIGGGAVLGHLYLYRRLVRKLHVPTWARTSMAAFLALMTILLLMRRPIRDLHPEVERVYELFTYSWMALALCLILAVMVGDGIRWLLAHLPDRAQPRAIQPPLDAASSEPMDSDRRLFLARALPLTVLAGGAMTASYASLRAFMPPEVSEVAVRLRNLPRSLDGLTIVQLSDIHVGPFIGRGFLERLVAEVNALRPDVIALTGDLVDGDVARLGPAVSVLGKLRARFGTFMVTGNHEYYSGVVAWTRFFESLGVSVLRNRRVTLGDAGASLDLVGVDDWSGARRRGGQGYDLEAALAGQDADRASVLLAHQPTNFRVAAARGVGLQLSGHTHGGQLFPMTMLVGLGYEYHRGLYHHEDSHIYVSRGSGFWGPPARLGSPPELVKVTLTT